MKKPVEVVPSQKHWILHASALRLALVSKDARNDMVAKMLLQAPPRVLHDTVWTSQARSMQARDRKLWASSIRRTRCDVHDSGQARWRDTCRASFIDKFIGARAEYVPQHGDVCC